MLRRCKLILSDVLNAADDQRVTLTGLLDLIAAVD